MCWASKMAAVVWRSALFLLVCVSAGHCLYEDEIGRTDWYDTFNMNNFLYSMLHLNPSCSRRKQDVSLLGLVIYCN